MAMYSMQLREIIESKIEDRDDYYELSNREKIELGRKRLFDFDYPIFDENYRKVFENHFIRTFYMREIGFETEGLFKFQLETWLLVNMPYFNKLFKSENIMYNPLSNTMTQTSRNTGTETNRKDTTDKETERKDNTESESEIDGKSESTTDTDEKVDSSTTTDTTENTTEDNFHRNVSSNTPDSRLELSTKDGSGIIEYASSIEENKEDNKRDTESNTETKSDQDTTENIETKETTNTQSDSTEDFTSDIEEQEKFKSDIEETSDYLERQAGKVGAVTYPQLIQEHRQAFLRVENRIFREMNQLFMLVY